MNADTARSPGLRGATLTHSRLTERVLGCFFDVYNELGGGFLESVYQNALAIAFRAAGVPAQSQPEVDVWFRGERVGSLRPDFLVDGVVIVEIKAVSALREEHAAQVLHYLRATATSVGLLLNFGPRPVFRRVVLERR